MSLQDWLQPFACEAWMAQMGPLLSVVTERPAAGVPAKAAWGSGGKPPSTSAGAPKALQPALRRRAPRRLSFDRMQALGPVLLESTQDWQQL